MNWSCVKGGVKGRAGDMLGARSRRKEGWCWRKNGIMPEAVGL